MLVKVHERKDGVIVSVIDKELAGKSFEENDAQLDLNSAFYKGQEMLDDEVGDLIRNARGINLVGEKAVKLAIDEGVIEENMVKRISGIPYYQGTVDLE